MNTLKVSEVQYLLEVLPLDEDLRSAVEGASVRVLDQLTPAQVDQLRDLCGERLQVVGFDREHEPNAEGRLLETLIDRLLIR